MTRADEWFQRLFPPREGTYRGMDIGMPLRDALALETGKVERLAGLIRVTEDLDADSVLEVELRFSRTKGLDRLSSLRCLIRSEKAMVDLEALFQRVVDHLGQRFGPHAPVSPATRDPGVRRHDVRSWKVQGHELPTTMTVELVDAVREMVHLTSVSVEMDRATQA